MGKRQRQHRRTIRTKRGRKTIVVNRGIRRRNITPEDKQYARERVVSKELDNTGYRAQLTILNRTLNEGLFKGPVEKKSIFERSKSLRQAIRRNEEDIANINKNILR